MVEDEAIPFNIELIGRLCRYGYGGHLCHSALRVHRLQRCESPGLCQQRPCNQTFQSLSPFCTVLRVKLWGLMGFSKNVAHRWKALA